jgi:hypothetical protein
MSESTVRAGIYELVGAISDIGIVHDYERWAADSARFIDLFKTTIDGVAQIRGVEITRGSAAEDETPERKHTYKLKCYMGLKDEDATEKTFNTIVEAICDAFRADQTIGGVAGGHDYAQVATIELRMFGSVLCHYAELAVTVYEQK